MDLEFLFAFHEIVKKTRAVDVTLDQSKSRKLLLGSVSLQKLSAVLALNNVRSKMAAAALA